MAAYYITGVSGTGKSTIVNELKKRGILAYDIDYHFCHWRHKKTGEEGEYFPGIGRDWLEAHEWICDLKKLKHLIEKHSNSDIVIAGVTSNQQDYLHYFSKVFLLHCGEETLLHRLNTRTTNQFAKNKEEQQIVLAWHKDFQNQMLSLGAIPIDAEEPIGDVVDKILLEIDKQ